MGEELTVREQAPHTRGAPQVSVCVSRHLKPGGRLAVLELGEPTFLPARWFVKYCVSLGVQVSCVSLWCASQLRKSMVCKSAA
jgi:hypothetical protein